MRWLIPFGVLAALLSSPVVAVAQQKSPSRGQMEVIFEPSLTANALAQKWTKILSDLGLAGVRFRPMQNGDQVAVKSEGSGDGAIYFVTAMLNNRGALATSGGQFTLSDGAKLK